MNNENQIFNNLSESEKLSYILNPSTPSQVVYTLRSVFVNSPPPKPEVILTNFFAEPTVLLVLITSRVTKRT
jgi:hypothetical protein